MSTKATTNEQRCQMSELLIDQCDHCRRMARVIEYRDDTRPVLDEIIIAQTPDTCQVCHEDIVAGDHIGLIDEVKVPGKEGKVKRWAHYGCGK